MSARKCKYGRRVKGKCPVRKSKRKKSSASRGRGRSPKRVSTSSWKPLPTEYDFSPSTEWGYWDGSKKVNPGIYASSIKVAFPKLQAHAAKRGITLVMGKGQFYWCPYGCGPSGVQS